VSSLLFGCFWNKRERSYSAVSSWLAAAMQIESSPFDANIRKLFRPTSYVEKGFAETMFGSGNKVLREIECEVAKTKTVPEVAPQGPLPRTEPVSSAVLFSRPVIRRTLIGILIKITVGFTLYGFLQWLPTIFVKQGMTMTSALQILMVMSIGKTVGAAIGMVLADWAGRKPSIAIFALLSALLGVGLAFAHDQTFVTMSFALAVALGVTNTISFTVYVPELFETRYRLRGTGLCGASGRLATSVVQFLVVYLYANGGLPSIIAMLGGLLVLESIAVYFFGPETKQVSLEAAASKDPDMMPARLSIVPSKS